MSMAVPSLIVVWRIRVVDGIATNTPRYTRTIRRQSSQMTTSAHLSKCALVLVDDCRHACTVHTQHALQIVRFNVRGAQQEGITSFLVESAQVEELGDCFFTARGEVRVVLL